MNSLIFAVPGVALLGLLFIYIRAAWVVKQDQGDDRMKEIAGYIAKGAMSFLKAEYKVLAIYVVLASILLGVISTVGAGSESAGNAHSASSPLIVVSFIVGAVFSALAGFLGMRIATKANVRTAQAARTSLTKALDISFAGGAVMGIGVASLAVLGLSGPLYPVSHALCSRGHGG